MEEEDGGHPIDSFNESRIHEEQHEFNFPSELLEREDRLHGGILLHISLAVYTCYALALICENYFVPALHQAIERLGMAYDVAGATLMAFGSATPGLCISIIGTFVTDDDLGFGNIIGSCVFAVYAITGVCGAFIKKPIHMDWWPITRDCAVYVTSLCILGIIIYDSRIYWYETLILLSGYVIYILMLCYDKSLRAFVKYHTQWLRKVFHNSLNAYDSSNDTISDPHNDRPSEPHRKVVTIALECTGSNQKPPTVQLAKDDKKPAANTNESHETHLLSWSMPKDSMVKSVLWVLTLPITLLCHVCLIDCRKDKWKKFFPITFLVAIMLIGSLTYIVSWMVDIIGMTFGLSQALMGYTAMAIGTSIPDMFLSLTVARQGHGNMALANSLGSNIIEALVNLNIPWFIKSLFFKKEGYVFLPTEGKCFTVIFMVLSMIPIYSLLAWYRFHLNRKLGITSLCFYAVFVIGSILINVL